MQSVQKTQGDSTVSLIGVGVYSVGEAARLTGIPNQRISRWLRGYAYRYNDEVRSLPALWETRTPAVYRTIVVTFLDMMEIRFADAFREAGVSLPTIRRTLLKARQIFDSDYPFSTRRFSTDGRKIFAEVAKETQEPVLLDLLRGQYESRRLVSQSLYATLDFDETSQATRWWPHGRSKRVVVDPSRSFGQPIDSPTGIPTASLSDAAKAEGSIAAAARWYGVEQAAVRSSVAFERALAA